MNDYNEASLRLHRNHRGKIGISIKTPLQTREDLSLMYTPGVAAACQAIADDPIEAYSLTVKGNAVAVLSDGSAVLGMGNIGPAAALPVMEGKALLFKEFANIDAIPLCVEVHSDEELIAIARSVAPNFGGINLEDIAAPRCFVVEDALQDIGIPVFHDDQHGTAVVLLAALKNAAKVIGRDLTDMTVVINGAGAAGTAIARILRCVNYDPNVCISVKDVLMCDSKGILSSHRADLSPVKKEVLHYVNRTDRQGTLHDALEGANAFIGVSRGNLLDGNDIKRMAPNPIILAMANPIPEIMPDLAREAGAAVIGTGRSDFPNQVNNVLAFPGLFRGALDAKARRITDKMKLAAAESLAAAVDNPSAEKVLPDPLDRAVPPKVAQAVAAAAEQQGD